MAEPVGGSNSRYSSVWSDAADSHLADALIHEATDNGSVNTQKLAAAVADHPQEGLFNQIETRLGPIQGGHFARDYAAELISRNKADGPNNTPAGGGRPELLSIGLQGHLQGRAWDKLVHDGGKLSDADKAKAAAQYKQLQGQISTALNRPDLTVQERSDLDVAGADLFAGATNAGVIDPAKTPQAMVELGITAMANSSGGPAGLKGGRAPVLRGGHEPEQLGTPRLASPGKSIPNLPIYKDGDKTLGVLRANGLDDVPLQSGWDGPAAKMPEGARGFDIVTRTHVEGHAAATMRNNKISKATLYINNPDICRSCTKLLPRMLPAGTELTVVTPKGSTTFVGVPE